MTLILDFRRPIKCFCRARVSKSLFCSLHTEISPHDSLERVHELLIGSRVTERVDGTVEVTDEVGEHVDVNVDARRAEAGDDGQDVVRSPASHESAQDDADSF